MSHVLGRTSRVTYPHGMLLIDTWSRPISLPNNAEYEERILDGCVITALHVNKNEICSRSTIADCDLNGLLTLIDANLEPSSELYIIGHRIGLQLTLLGFWEYLSPSYGDIEYAMLDDPPTSLSITRKGCKIRIVDSLNYFPVAQSEIIAYLAVDGEGSRYASDLPHSLRDESVLFLHCLTTIFAQLLDSIVSDKWASWGPTAASIAWSSFTTSFLNHKIYIHYDDALIEQERAAFFGGRLEAHYLGQADEPIYALDCNSMYPTVMQHYQYPTCYLETITKPSLHDAERHCVYNTCLAYVRVKNEYTDYPVRIDHCPKWARGDFDTHLCGLELRRAIRDGYVVAVHYLHRYEANQIFMSYVEHWYRQRLANREANNRIGETICKLFLNSLFGKFGQRSARWVKTNDVVPIVRYGTWLHIGANDSTPTKYMSIAGQAFKEAPPGNWVNAFPAISACVTANAREHMADVKRRISPCKVYYEDADCLHVDKDGYLNASHHTILSQSRLGAMKLSAIDDSPCYMGNRDYIFDGKRVLSSVKQSAERISDTQYRELVTQSLRGILQGDVGHSFTVKEVTLNMLRANAGGRIREDGWLTPNFLYQYVQ